MNTKRYTIQQHVLIVLHYCQNDESLVATIREVFPVFGMNNMSNSWAMKKIIKKIRKFCLRVVDVKHKIQTRNDVQELGISTTTLHRMLTKCNLLNNFRHWTIHSEESALIGSLNRRSFGISENSFSGKNNIVHNLTHDIVRPYYSQLKVNKRLYQIIVHVFISSILSNPRITTLNKTTRNSLYPWVIYIRYEGLVISTWPKTEVALIVFF